VPWALGAAVGVALMAPMLFTHRSFGVDWGGHLWLVYAQMENVNQLGHPSYFIQSTLGAFYPWFAFYGGTLYGGVGVVAALLGSHVTPVYVASYALGLALALGGMTWPSRQAGLRGWAAAVPGVVYVTSAYYVTNVYARGAWPETIAISALPVVIAGAVAIIRSPRVGAGPAAAVIGGAAVVSGSHNITLLWGTVFLAALAALALISSGPARGEVARRLAVTAGLFALGVGINLWFLSIAIRLGHEVPIEEQALHRRPRNSELDLAVLLSPWRFSRFAGNQPTLDLQAPTLLLLWSGVALWLAPLRTPVVRRLALGLGVLLVPLCVLLAFQATWSVLPRELWVIQFPFRLETYVVLCAAGLVILGLLGLRKASGRLRTALVAGLAAILAFDVGQALAQAWRTPSYVGDRARIVARPPTRAPRWFDHFATHNQFVDVGAPIVRPTLATIPGVTAPGLPAQTDLGLPAQTLSLPVAERIRARYERRFRLAQPGSVITNVNGSPRLITIDGGHAVGRTPDSRMIVYVHPPPRPGEMSRLAFSPARTRGIVAGWIASILCLLASIVVVGGLWWRGRRR
jgi:hypothetical protein